MGITKFYRAFYINSELLPEWYQIRAAIVGRKVESRGQQIIRAIFIFLTPASTVNSQQSFTQCLLDLAITQKFRHSLNTMAYLVNPMLLNQQIVNAHLDVLLANTLIVLIGCLYSGRYVCDILAIWVWFLVKTLPIIWLPLVFAFLFNPRRGRDLAAGFLLSLLRITVITYTFLPTVAACKSLLNPRVVSGTAQERKYSVPSHREFTVAVERNFLTFLVATNP
jgi:hypothetical protein